MNATQTLKVLILEDNEVDVLLIKETFAADGGLDPEVTTADSLSEALEHLDARCFDVVLADLGLPDSQGLETFAKLHHHASNVPILVLTGRTDERVGRKALSMGAQDYLVKDELQTRALCRAVRYAIERTRKTQQLETVRDELRTTNRDLDRLVRERTEELEEAIEELEAFSHSVSHDLRAPLRAISAFAGILKDNFASGLPREGRGLLERIVINTQRMDRLIDDLLKLSRVGHSKITRSHVDMRALAAEVLRELLPSHRGRTINWLVRDMPPCNGDRSLLRQVFVNLLSNAVKFTRKKERPCVEVGWQDHDGLAVYHVKDNGAGFDMQYAGNLVGVFQRMHRAEDYEGTGVGLSIVARIIRRHGGIIWAEAEVNEGATFYFTVPDD